MIAVPANLFETTGPDVRIMSSSKKERLKIIHLLTVSNRGPDSATDVTVENFLPSELTNVTAKPSQGTYKAGIWQLGGLAKYRSAKVVLNVQVPALALPGKIPNTAYVYGNEYDPDNSNNHDTAYIQVRADNLTVA